MKKNFLGFAIAAMSMISFTAAAQSVPTTTCTTKECTAGKAKSPQRPKADLFAGMNLTESQKANLAALKENRARQHSEMKKTALADKQPKATARKTARKQYLAEVKAIIGTDNYVLFLENMAVNGHNGTKAVGQGKIQRKGAKPMGKRRGATKSAEGQAKG